MCRLLNSEICKSKLRYSISINRYNSHNLSLQNKYHTHVMKLLSWKTDFDCLSIYGIGRGFRVMFVFRFNLNGKLRFIVSSVRNVLFTFSKLMKHLNLIFGNQVQEIRYN